MFELDASDINQVAARFEASSRDVARQAGRLLQETALDVESTAKEFAPVRTGNLRRSITHEVRDVSGGAEAIVGTDVEYAPYVEQGTSRMAPRAFLGPALDKHGPDFAAGLGRIAEGL